MISKYSTNYDRMLKKKTFKLTPVNFVKTENIAFKLKRKITKEYFTKLQDAFRHKWNNFKLIEFKEN